MRRFILCAGLAIISIALAVRAVGAFETRATKLQAIKTVGIISALGDDMSFTRAGLTGVSNTSQTVAIQVWGLDDLIVQQVSKLLGERFQVQAVSYPRAEFAAVKESSVAPVNLLRSDPFKSLVRNRVSPQGLDAYIVITRSKSKFGTGRSVEGIGFIEYRTLLSSYSQIHALYEIRLISGKDFDVIVKQAASPLDNSETMRVAGPNRSVDDTFKSPTASDKLRSVVVDLVTRSLPITLTDMHLMNTQ